ncbi:hypothetical protein BDV93DRAFT_524498 [Ceratobasidium sp. AG-I]|nr:hypothetical protein BDV93DRAFT_524498 [Ceratobasidium sp. AG-I]
MKIGTPKKIKEIVVPFTPQVDFARFDFYASHIKILNLFGKKSPFFLVSGWHALYPEANKGPLLPKLSSLTVRAPPEHPASEMQCLRWITILVAPSLKSFRFLRPETDPYPIGDGSITNDLLEPFASVCPIPRKTFFEYISTFRDLSALETGTMMIRPEAFLVLAELPRLERLTLCSVSNEPAPGLINLPDHSFPVLKRLVLKSLSRLEVEVVLGQLPLTRNIDSLKVLMSLGEGNEGWVVGEFLPRLANMTRLTDLCAYFDESEDIIEQDDLSVPVALDVLAKLPLQVLDLRGVAFEDYVDFTNIFPVLTKLQMADQLGTPRWLSSFATIPKLEHLIVDVDLREDLDPWRDNIRCRSLQTLEATDIDGLSCTPTWTIHAAEYLLEIFPCIVRVAGPVEVKVWEKVEDKVVVWFNSQIRLIREINSLRNRISDHYGYKEGPRLIPESFLVNAYVE